MESVGVIGLGSMGSGIVKNLCAHNFAVNVFDISESRVKVCVSFGAKPAEDYDAIAQKSDMILLVLPMAPFDPALEEVVLGKGRLLELMKPGSVLMDCGNTSPLLEKKFDAEAAKRGISFLDTPVSGGPQGAESASLSILAGGSFDDFQRCMPVLKAIGKEINYFGPAGMGQMAKLANNILVATTLAAVSEVLVFATKAGLDPGKLVTAFSGGAASSWVLQIYGKGIINRSAKDMWTPGIGSNRQAGRRDKQLAWALQIADELETPLPMTATAYNMYMMAGGRGKSGQFTPIVEMLENMTNTIVLPKKRKESNKRKEKK